MSQLRDLRGSRRDLAIAFADGEKTAHEVARALGRSTGSIFGVLRRMHADGLLTTDSDPDPPTRGTQYQLTSLARELLAHALSLESGVGQLAQGQRLLIVQRMEDRLRPSEVFTKSSNAGIIAWAAEMPNGWLLVVGADVESFRAKALCAAFEKAGCRCYEDCVDAVVAGSLQRARAETLVSD